MAFEIWNTQSEIDWLKDLTRRGKLKPLRQYAALVLGGMRRYDPQVDVPRVQAWCRGWLAGMEASGDGQ
jgi:hypothetical protein